MISYRDYFQKLKVKQDGTRSLFESIAIPEVASALKDWNRQHNNSGVVIGGCASSYHALPRATMDLDVLYMSPEHIPNSVPEFKRSRPGAFLHKPTHVEVEVIHPNSINISHEMAKAVFDDADTVDGVKVASPSGIVALKLHRLKNHDIGDIVAMHGTGRVDLSKYPLTKEHHQQYEEIIKKYAD